MGKALYRKYRSKKLNEVVGQKHITDTLEKALKSGSISHAYLFTGPRGVGKTSIARILAHEINDISYDDESIHLDIIEIDAASNRRIDEMRDLRDKVHIAPTSSKYKVYIIDEVHMLTREAFNALLKTLEEPPEHAVFILATTEAHKVPDTITSRTQKFTFKPISHEDAVGHLKVISDKENIKIDDEALNLVAKHGNGSFRDSISILDQLSNIGKSDSIELSQVSDLLGIPDDEIIDDLIKFTANNDIANLLNSIKKLQEKGVDPSLAARILSSKLREDILNNENYISQKETISILKDLLPYTYTAKDYSGLELCLLDAMNLKIDKNSESKLSNEKLNNKRKQEVGNKDQENKPSKIKHVTKDKEIPTEKKSEKENIKKTIKELNPENWQSLLDSMKSEHNTLYGILRMAEFEKENDKIILTFSFDFHKKKIDSPSNKSTLTKYINEFFGNTELRTLSKKKADKLPKESNKNSNESISNKTIENVSNIFGDAELLES